MTLFNFALLLIVQFAEFSEGRNFSDYQDCNNSRSDLLKALFETEGNLYELDRVFAPERLQTSTHVRVTYTFLDNDDLEEGNCSVHYIWAQGGFLLIQPPTLFEFSSLFFSRPSNPLENLYLTLPYECRPLVMDNINNNNNCTCNGKTRNILDRLTQQLNEYTKYGDPSQIVQDISSSAQAVCVDELEEKYFNKEVMVFLVFTVTIPVIAMVIIGVVVRSLHPTLDKKLTKSPENHPNLVGFTLAGSCFMVFVLVLDFIAMVFFALKKHEYSDIPNITIRKFNLFIVCITLIMDLAVAILIFLPFMIYLTCTEISCFYNCRRSCVGCCLIKCFILPYFYCIFGSKPLKEYAGKLKKNAGEEVALRTSQKATLTAKQQAILKNELQAILNCDQQVTLTTTQKVKIAEEPHVITLNTGQPAIVCANGNVTIPASSMVTLFNGHEVILCAGQKITLSSIQGNGLQAKLSTKSENITLNAGQKFIYLNDCQEITLNCEQVICLDAGQTITLNDKENECQQITLNHSQNILLSKGQRITLSCSGRTIILKEDRHITLNDGQIITLKTNEMFNLDTITLNGDQEFALDCDSQEPIPVKEQIKFIRCPKFTMKSGQKITLTGATKITPNGKEIMIDPPRIALIDNQEIIVNDNSFKVRGYCPGIKLIKDHKIKVKELKLNREQNVTLNAGQKITQTTNQIFTGDRVITLTDVQEAKLNAGQIITLHGNQQNGSQVDITLDDNQENGFQVITLNGSPEITLNGEAITLNDDHDIRLEPNQKLKPGLIIILEGDQDITLNNEQSIICQKNGGIITGCLKFQMKGNQQITLIRGQGITLDGKKIKLIGSQVITLNDKQAITLTNGNQEEVILDGRQEFELQANHHFTVKHIMLNNDQKVSLSAGEITIKARQEILSSELTLDSSQEVTLNANQKIKLKGGQEILQKTGERSQWVTTLSPIQVCYVRELRLKNNRISPTLITNGQNPFNQRNIWIVTGLMLAPLFCIASHSGYILAAWVTEPAKTTATFLLALGSFLYLFFMFRQCYIVHKDESGLFAACCKDDGDHLQQQGCIYSLVPKFMRGERKAWRRGYCIYTCSKHCKNFKDACCSGCKDAEPYDNEHRNCNSFRACCYECCCSKSCCTCKTFWIYFLIVFPIWAFFSHCINAASICWRTICSNSEEDKDNGQKDDRSRDIKINIEEDKNTDFSMRGFFLSCSWGSVIVGVLVLVLSAFTLLPLPTYQLAQYVESTIQIVLVVLTFMITYKVFATDPNSKSEKRDPGIGV